MSEIKVGDIVKLKSGGPNMTVTSNVGGLYQCQHFIFDTISNNWCIGQPIEVAGEALVMLECPCNA